ncbi:Aste57867_4591 [Aphanomyces stellatus]|uniref:Aste57867_4591 protein n=1 Tax=Aphanomyces stellatus TaxID=120398 RepID=A0A485KD31_9STRA|nr:hypothetical protein As57867_004578 [Aphanomyces stellatus]VFT81696.1 Aste57867_4591 [Aphanomyces stellatus]
MLFGVTKSAALALCLGLFVLSTAQEPFDSDDFTESICNVDESQNFLCYNVSEPAKIRTGLPVARLKVNNSWCTGWLFGSEGHVITNNHCVPNNSIANLTIVEFAAITPNCNAVGSRGSHPGRYVANSTTILATDIPLDYTLLRLNLNPGMDVRAYGYLQARDVAATLSESVYVIGHPRGFPKRIAMVKDGNPGKITTTNYTETRPTICRNVDRLGHNLDTERGSSGSPVLAADSNLVVGLHNCGGCSPSTQAYGSNYAVKILQIVDSLRAKNLLPRDAVAPTPPRTPSPTPSRTLSPTPSRTPSPIPSRTPSPTPSPTPSSTPSPRTPPPALTSIITFEGANITVLHTDEPSPFSQCTVEKDNIDFEGNDIASTSRREPDDCCDDCTATPGCQVYVWSDYNGGTCWLKSAKGAMRFAYGLHAASISSDSL